jgi:hypothetical protein
MEISEPSLDNGRGCPYYVFNNIIHYWRNYMIGYAGEIKIRAILDLNTMGTILGKLHLLEGGSHEHKAYFQV